MASTRGCFVVVIMSSVRGRRVAFYHDVHAWTFYYVVQVVIILLTIMFFQAVSKIE